MRRSSRKGVQRHLPHGVEGHDEDSDIETQPQRYETIYPSGKLPTGMNNILDTFGPGSSNPSLAHPSIGIGSA